jgi:hypothetical protein
MAQTSDVTQEQEQEQEQEQYQQHAEDCPATITGSHQDCNCRLQEDF